jgi:hypothetical protein
MDLISIETIQAWLHPKPFRCLERLPMLFRSTTSFRDLNVLKTGGWESVPHISTKFFLFAALVLGTSSVLTRQESGHIHGIIETHHQVMFWLEQTSVRKVQVWERQQIFLMCIWYVRFLPALSSYRSPGGNRGKDTPTELESGANHERDFSLIVEGTEGREFVVTAQARGQCSAINRQIASSAITGIAAAEQIHKLTDVAEQGWSSISDTR